MICHIDSIQVDRLRTRVDSGDSRVLAKTITPQSVALRYIWHLLTEVSDLWSKASI